MKTIGGKTGAFTIIHEGQRLKVMFVKDYLVQNKTTHYKLDLEVKAGKVQLLEIQGRKRMKRLVLVESKAVVKSPIISCESGIFTVYASSARKVLRVMFINQYATLKGLNSKEVVSNRLDSSTFKVEAIQLTRSSDININFIIVD